MKHPSVTDGAVHEHDSSMGNNEPAALAGVAGSDRIENRVSSSDAPACAALSLKTADSIESDVSKRSCLYKNVWLQRLGFGANHTPTDAPVKSVVALGVTTAAVLDFRELLKSLDSVVQAVRNEPPWVVVIVLLAVVAAMTLLARWRWSKEK